MGSLLAESLQFRILCFGFFQDRDVGVRVFPDREEVLVGPLRVAYVALKSVCACKTETRESSEREVQRNSAVINQVLELRCCAIALTG